MCEMNNVPVTEQKDLIKRGRESAFTNTFFFHWRVGSETAPSFFIFNHNIASPHGALDLQNLLGPSVRVMGFYKTPFQPDSEEMYI